MTRERMIRLAGVAVVLTLVAAACGSGSSSPAGGGGGTSSSAGGATVSTADSDLGTILVDGDGNTVYLFKQDTGSTSTCTGDCAGTWPALTTDGAPQATGAADAALLGTSTRDDGTTQVTYAGHPLYRYAGDTGPGDTNGQGVGGIWFAVAQDGTPAGGSGGGGGYTRGGYG
jgi:predicted lipoprotein with Yx(FWY)xxD motif